MKISIIYTIIETSRVCSCDLCCYLVENGCCKDGCGKNGETFCKDELVYMFTDKDEAIAEMKKLDEEANKEKRRYQLGIIKSLGGR